MRCGENTIKKKKMKYGIIGTGAIGGYYGSRLAHSGQEVHFLLHKDYEYVREHGLQVDSCDGNFHLDHPHVYNDSREMPVCDVVLVGLKTINNHLLRNLLPPLVDENSVVVLIQNGVGVEDDVQAMFPDLQLVAGLAFICSAKTQPGMVSHQCYGHINLGNFSCRNAQKVEAIVAELNAAGVKTGLVEYHEARWKKAVWNMPFNGMTVALNTRTDLLLKNASTRRLIKEQMMEVVNAARALGVGGLDEGFADLMIRMTDDMTPYSPSMKLDFDFHRQMEIEYLYTKPLQKAAAAGCPLPKLEMLEAERRFLQEGYLCKP